MSPQNRSHQHYRAVVASLLMTLLGVIISSLYTHQPHPSLNSRIIAYTAVAVFIVSAVICLHILTEILYRLIAGRRLGIGRAAAMRFVVRVIGYLVIVLIALELIGVSIEKLLLGGAVIGIILGVAAQQALMNFFAGVVLIITHPYRVGEEVILFSGALGGKYEGKIADISTTHTKLRQKDGQIVLMPNAAILSGTAIIPLRHKKPKH